MHFTSSHGCWEIPLQNQFTCLSPWGHLRSLGYSPGGGMLWECKDMWETQSLGHWLRGAGGEAVKPHDLKHWKRRKNDHAPLSSHRLEETDPEDGTHSREDAVYKRSVGVSNNSIWNVLCSSPAQQMPTRIFLTLLISILCFFIFLCKHMWIVH